MTAARLPHAATIAPPAEQRRTLDRFGGTAELRVVPPPGHELEAARRLDRAAGLLAKVDAHLSRFDAASELSQLNADPRHAVPASALMQRFVEAVRWAGAHSGGLVDAACLEAVERAGYRDHLPAARLGAIGWDAALTARASDPDGSADAAPGRSVRPSPSASELPGTWREVDVVRGEVVRPPGLRLDSGGIGKGLAADFAAAALRGAPSWLVDCGGDLRIGGTSGRPRSVAVLDPVDQSTVLHRLLVTRGAVATSGVTRRAWLQPGGDRSHHLIDPRTGRPADTGVLQVTALAPTGLEAEVFAKTVLLLGAERAPAALPHGGVVVSERGVVTVIEPPAVTPMAGARSW